jgi:hypothetical protein
VAVGESAQVRARESRSGDAGTGAAQLREQPGRQEGDGRRDESLGRQKAATKVDGAVTWTKTGRVGGCSGCAGGRRVCDRLRIDVDGGVT